MGETAIEWTDISWNPGRGCSKVSAGCKNCYAMRIASRFCRGDGSEEASSGQVYRVLDPLPFHGFAENLRTGPHWTGRVELIESKLTEPLHRPSWRGKRVFVNSMSDLFHEGLPDEAIDKVFAVMALCPDVTFQVLTKRPERMLEWFDAGFDNREEAVGEQMRALDSNDPGLPDWPLPNVHLGVSVENQATADERIPLLLQTPAAVRWVSVEPMLEAVDLGGHLTTWRCADCGEAHRPDEPAWRTVDGCWEHHHGYPAGHVPARRFGGLDWVVAGAESGPGARPAELDWFRSLRDQCAEAGVSFFMKQLCRKGRKIPFAEFPEDLQVREWPEEK